MKVYLITAEDSFYTIPLLNEFINDGCEIVEVAIVDGFITKKRIISSLYIYGFYRFLKMSIITIWYKLVGGKVEKHLVNNGLKVIHVNQVNEESFVKHLEALNFDLLLSHNCPQLIKKRLLKTAGLYSINLHMGLLPDYRGVFPIWRAMVNNEFFFGVTLHLMDEEFDNGKIILQESCLISPEDSLFDLYIKAAHLGGRVIAKSIKLIEVGLVSFSNNDGLRKRYYGFPTVKEILALKKNNNT